MSQAQAIEYLNARGNSVREVESGGLKVFVSPRGGKQQPTVKDVEAINALRDVVTFRVIASWGIAPDMFARLRIFPRVSLVAIHYQMPAESIAFLDRFPNTETLKFWADHFISLEKLPALPKLRILHHESTEGEMGMDDVRAIVACRNLEEIKIYLPITEEAITRFRTLPKLEFLLGRKNWDDELTNLFDDRGEQDVDAQAAAAVDSKVK